MDRHVTSSVFECSMVLTTAAQECGYSDPDDDLYFTRPDLPLTRWEASSHDNWRRRHEYTVCAHDGGRLPTLLRQRETYLFEWSHGRTPPSWLDAYTFPERLDTHPY